MFDEENEPKKKLTYQIGQNISEFSIDELSELIVKLEAEIERLKIDKKAKKQSKSAANNLFKS